MPSLDSPLIGRRERKKAATRLTIAAAAARLFAERGYDAVGIRDIAEEADVAVTTLFAHFPSKEALVFEREADFERLLADAVAARSPGELVPTLKDAVGDLVAHMTSDESAPVVRMIDATPALRRYEAALRARYADRLATAIADDLGVPAGAAPVGALARFAVDAYILARDAADPVSVLDEVFRMIEAAWAARPADPPITT